MIATNTYMAMAIQIWVLTALLEVHVEALNPQVLFDPTEEQFHLPASPIKLGDEESGQSELVGQKDEPEIFFGVIVMNATQESGVQPRSFRPGEFDGLVGAHSGQLVDGMRLTAVELGIALGTSDKESACLGHPE